MDVKREGVAKQKLIRRIIWGVLGVAALGGVSVAVARLKPAAQTVESATVWMDTVKRGPMLRQVRGLGTLVAEETIIVPTVTEGRVARRWLLPGAAVHPDSIIVSLSNPELDQQALDAEFQVKMAGARLDDLKVKLETETLNQKADLARVEKDAMQAKLRNGGAACTAANRFYVHRDQLAEFERLLCERMGALAMGPGTDRSNHLGALVSTAERDKVARLVDDAVAQGARLVLGGIPDAEGAFYPPTILADVEHGSPITRTEVFGPVAVIIAYDEVDDAVAMANDTEYGLIAYVFGDESAALRVAHRLDAGMVGVNRGLLSDPAAPFGGTKESGLGREGGSEGILEFTEEKYIAMNP